MKGLPPYQSGGDMIEKVDFAGTTKELPSKFEAGTPNIAGIMGLKSAINYLNALDRIAAASHEQALLERSTKALEDINGLRIIGTAEKKPLSFLLFLIDSRSRRRNIFRCWGISIRTGHHCTMPLLKRFSVPATVRASFAFYNNENDVEALFDALKKMKVFFDESKFDANYIRPYLLRHSKSPSFMENYLSVTHYSDGFNPICGDAVTLYMNLEGSVITSQFI